MVSCARVTVGSMELEVYLRMIYSAFSSVSARSTLRVYNFEAFIDA